MVCIITFCTRVLWVQNPVAPIQISVITNGTKGRWGKNTVIELTKHYLKEYEEFIKNNPDKKPSIDRIDEDGKYEIGNCQIISLGDNVRKCNKIKNINPSKYLKKPVQGLIDGEWRWFGSVREAGRETGVHSANISSCCRGHKNYSYAGKDSKGVGIKWRHAV